MNFILVFVHSPIVLLCDCLHVFTEGKSLYYVRRLEWLIWTHTGNCYSVILFNDFKIVRRRLNLGTFLCWIIFALNEFEIILKD